MDLFNDLTINEKYPQMTNMMRDYIKLHKYHVTIQLKFKSKLISPSLVILKSILTSPYKNSTRHCDE